MGIGVGLPGVVDTDRGSLVYAPNLGWRDTPVRDILQQVFDLPVLVDNEANCAALGEYRFGISQDVLDVIYLSANVGLGGGILSNGQVFRGSHGFASEIGHAVIDPAGPACGCGRFGCWETFVGTRAVVDLVKRRLPDAASILETNDPIHFEDVLSAARNGDALAISALAQVGRFLGIGITNLVNIFNPRQVVLGGTLGKAADLLLPEISSVVFGESLLSTRADLRLDASALKEEACLLGAVSLVYDEVIRDPVDWIANRKNNQ
jgi:glucokinase-like ROK family protein